MKNLRRLACKFDLNQTEHKSSQVNASARKAWPNGIASRPKFLPGTPFGQGSIHNICFGLLVSMSPVSTAGLNTSTVNKVIYLLCLLFQYFVLYREANLNLVMSSYFVRSLGSRFEDVHVRPFVSGCNTCQQQVGAKNI